MNKDYIVTKSNKLVSCGYDLSLQEQRIILTLASMVQPQDTEFKEYEFKIKDFMELLGIQDKHTYSEIRKITKELMRKVFEIKEGKDIIQLAWLSSVRYKTGEGTVILKFDSSLKPYMLGLKELYTSYRIENVLSLKSKYSIRLYEILKSNLFKKHITIELEDLKTMISAIEKTYSVYQNVKNRILLQAQKEINLDKTDISFTFEEIKTGRKVTSIKFNIISTSNKPIKEISITGTDPQQNDEPLDLIKQVHDIFYKHKITSNEAICLLKDSNNNIELLKKYYDYSLTKDIDRSLVGYIRALIKDFNEPKNNIKVDTFNDYDQRPFDTTLEDKLLNGITEEEPTEPVDNKAFIERLKTRKVI